MLAGKEPQRALGADTTFDNNAEARGADVEVALLLSSGLVTTVAAAVDALGGDRRYELWVLVGLREGCDWC
jgi:hypothetical protein